MSYTADPGETYALVVGIEEYAARGSWNELDGPVPDARQFTDWLRNKGVPTENIILCLAPRPSNMELMTISEPGARPATSQVIREALTDTLRHKQGDLLYVFWGGHGMMPADEQRRLFYADARQDNMLNLDLNAALRLMKSTIYEGFKQQICIIDACANYLPIALNVTTLPHETFAYGDPSQQCKQSVFLAAKAGDVAKNMTHEQTGLFSREVFAYLDANSNGGWPPASDAMAIALAERFIQLRESGVLEQTPNFFSYQSGDGHVMTMATVKNTAPKAVVLPTLRPKLLFEQKVQLRNALIDCAMIRDLHTRSYILLQLRPAIWMNILYQNTLNVHVLSIIDTCLNHHGGIAELIYVLKLHEESICVENLERVARQFGLIPPT